MLEPIKPISGHMAEWEPSPSASDPSRGDTDVTSRLLSLSNKDLQSAAAPALKAERPRPSAVHHHHHYPPTALLPGPPAGFPSASAAHGWTGSTLPALPT